MVNNYDKMNPSFFVGKVPCFMIVSHSHFLKANVEAIEDKMKNNECYMVEYTIDEGSKTLVYSKVFEQYPLFPNVSSSLTSKDIQLKKEKNKTSEMPHHLLKEYFTDVNTVPTTTYKIITP